jgi:GT2 family glycosyltransferase/ADP-heptose:LPS heptosyltransferase
MDVTCVVSTKDRYDTTLAHCMLAVVQQTVKPKYFILFDDSTNARDIRPDPVFSHIISLFNFYKIDFYVEYGAKRGQVANHIRSCQIAKTKWIWRLDDDNVPEHNVLERLSAHLADDVGAVGGLVIDSNKIDFIPQTASNAIEDIYISQNEQWYLPFEKKVKEVDHLYSSFIYNKDIAEYNEELSPIGHREETMLTYEMKRKGYKVLFDNSVCTWHFCSPTGGIRSNEREHNNNAVHDEQVFTQKMFSWNVKPAQYEHLVLENGLGDHYVFKSMLKEYLELHKDKKCTFYTCFPEVFKDCGIKQASIADAYKLLGKLDRFSIYRWCIDQCAKDPNWKQPLRESYRQFLKIPQQLVKPTAVSGTGNYIIISPYSHNEFHPKSYPMWDELVEMIKPLGYKLIQIGRKDDQYKDAPDITMKNSEKEIKGVDEILWNLPLTTIEEMIKGCKTWIAVDNFLQHLVNNMAVPTKGIVIWSYSDPEIFGYEYNYNLLGSNKAGVSYLRKGFKQYDTYHSITKAKVAFPEPQKIKEIFDII